MATYPGGIKTFTQLVDGIDDVLALHANERGDEITAIETELGTFPSERLYQTGDLKIFAGTTTPSGWLLCDGSAVSRTAYAALFAVIGTAYGAGDGSTTFNLPNFTDRFPRGHPTPGTGAGNDAHTHGAGGYLWTPNATHGGGCCGGAMANSNPVPITGTSGPASDLPAYTKVRMLIKT